VTSKTGSMARLVIKDSITSGGALASDQTLRLGDFTMIARSAVKPTMTSQVIKNRLRVDSEYSKRMDPADLSSLNKLLDRIAAMGVATDYDQIGLKPDQREIKSPPITRQIAVVEEPDTCLQNDTPSPPNPESGLGPGKSLDIPEPELISLVAFQTPDSKLGQGSDLKPPTHHMQYSTRNSGHPDICDLTCI